MTIRRNADGTGRIPFTAGIVLDQRNDAVEPHDDTDDLLLGVFNSSLTAVVRETEARDRREQAMNRNELTVDGPETMRVPDIRRFSGETQFGRSWLSGWNESATRRKRTTRRSTGS